MKKVLTVALACCLAATGAFAMAGCGENTDTDHTIVFYSSQGDKLVGKTQKAIDAFEKKYPGWKIDHQQPGGYDEVLDKVRSDLTADLQPDLAYCYADHVAQYIDSGKVVDISKYLTNAEPYTYTIGEESTTIDRIGFTEAEVAQFIDRYMDEGYAKNFTGAVEAGFDGEKSLLTLPFVKSTELLFYNPDALEQLEVEVPKTWDELWLICEKAKAKWPKGTPLGYDSEANWFITMAEQLGFGYTSVDANNHFLFNNDAAKAWLADLRIKYTKKYITTQEIYGSYTSSLFTKGPEEGLVFCIGSSGGASNQASTVFETAVAPIPGVMRDADGNGEPELHNECISQGPSLVMLTGGNGASNPTEKEIMTFQFVKELLAVSFQAEFAIASGYNPMRNDVFTFPVYENFLNEKDTDGETDLEAGNLVIAKSAKAAMGLTDMFFTSPAFVGSSTARQQMTRVMQYVLLGQKQPDKALSDAYKNCGGK